MSRVTYAMCDRCPTHLLGPARDRRDDLPPLPTGWRVDVASGETLCPDCAERELERTEEEKLR